MTEVIVGQNSISVPISDGGEYTVQINEDTDIPLDGSATFYISKYFNDLKIPNNILFKIMKEKVSQAIIVVRYSCHEVVFLPRTYFCNAKLYSNKPTYPNKYFVFY